MLRWMAAAVVTFALSATPTQAHSPIAPAPTTSTLTPGHFNAANDTLRALLIESNVLSDAALQAYTSLIPAYREQMESALFFGTLPRAQREAVLEYISNAGPIVQEETVRNASELIERFSPRLAGIFTEQELADIAAFMRTPVGAHVFRDSVLESLQHGAGGVAHADHAEFTTEETDAIAAFEATAGGLAFNARVNELGPIMRELGREALDSPSVSARIRRDVCGIAGPRCPRAWRGL